MSYIDPDTVEEAAAALVSLRDAFRNTLRHSVCCARVTAYCEWYIKTSITYGRKWFTAGKEFLLSMNPAKREA
jgi:hypothetical protein